MRTSRERSPSKGVMRLSWEETLKHLVAMETYVAEVAKEHQQWPYLWGIPMNGTVLSSMMSQRQRWPHLVDFDPFFVPFSQAHVGKEEGVLPPENGSYAEYELLVIIDDVADTGETIREIRARKDVNSHWLRVVVVTMFQKEWCKETGVYSSVYHMGEDAPWIIFPWESGSVDDLTHPDYKRKRNLHADL